MVQSQKWNFLALSSTEVVVTTWPESSFYIKRKQPFKCHDSEVLSRAVVWGGVSCEPSVFLTRSLFTRQQCCASSLDLTSQNHLQALPRAHCRSWADHNPWHQTRHILHWVICTQMENCPCVWWVWTYVCVRPTRRAALPMLCYQVWDSHEVSDLYF